MLYNHALILKEISQTKKRSGFFSSNYKNYYLFSYSDSIKRASLETNKLKTQNPINYFKMSVKTNDIHNYKYHLSTYNLYQKKILNNFKYLTFSSKLISKELFKIVQNNKSNFFYYKIIRNFLFELKKKEKMNYQLKTFFYLLNRIVKNSKNLPYSMLILYMNIYIRFTSLLINSKSLLNNESYNGELWKLTKKRHNKNPRSWIFKKYWLKVNTIIKSNKKTKQLKKRFFYKNLLNKSKYSAINFKNNILYSCFLS